MVLQESMSGEEDLPYSDPMAGLLQRVASEDRMAFHELYLSASPRLYGIALKLTRDPHCAKEALQDAMVQIWRHAARFDPLRGNAEAWMTGIVRFRALDLVASGQRRASRSEPLEGATELPDETALARMEATAEGSRLRRCLNQLEEKNRHSIVLAYVHGYSHSQIAKRLELPMGTIKAWIRRGLATLKACVGA